VILFVLTYATNRRYAS